MNKRIVTGTASAVGILLLILDAKTALHGANEAIDLCIRVLIPSLFPFFVLITLLNSAVVGRDIRILRPLELFLRIPKGTGSIFLGGMLGGYPSGAQLVHQSWSSGIVSRESANRMLSFCSNAGPAFIFGMIAAKFDSREIAWVIWLIHIASSLIVGRSISIQEAPIQVKLQTNQMTLADALRKSISIMASVCAWVLLFRILISFCSNWFLWALPVQIQVTIISFLELANGCSYLDLIENDGLRMIICSVSLNFGGICVAMQTSSVTQGLNMIQYLKGKVLQTAVSLYLTILAQELLFTTGSNIELSPVILISYPILMCIICYLHRNRKITVAFRRLMVYNQIRN